MAFNPLKVLNDLFIKEQATFKKGVVVSGSISGSNTTGIHVKKDAVIDGDLTVSGVVENSGYAQAGALQVDGILDVAGNSYLSGAVNVEGNMNVDGTLNANALVVDDLNVQKNFYIGTPQFFAAKEGGQNNASISYVYNSGKLFITPEPSNSGSYATASMVDLHSIDSSIPSGTMAVDVAKSMNSLDDFILRLSQVIEF